MRRRVLAAVTLTLVIITVVGCGAGVQVDENLALVDAKQIAQSGEREIVDALPEGVVGDIKQLQEGSFLRCSPDGAQRWSGHLTASIRGNPLPEAVIDAVVEHFSMKEGYAIRRRVDDGEPLVDIVTASGFLWITRYRDDRNELSIDSFSGCLRLPDDIWPGSPY